MDQGHDAAGNIIADTDAVNNVDNDYVYNAAGQLSVVVVDGQYSAEYSYDYLSRLSLRYIASGNQTIHYVHDLAGNIIAEYDGAGIIGREYIWLDERPMAVVDHSGASPDILHVHTDQLERPILMVGEFEKALVCLKNTSLKNAEFKKTFEYTKAKMKVLQNLSNRSIKIRRNLEL